MHKDKKSAHLIFNAYEKDMAKRMGLTPSEFVIFENIGEPEKKTRKVLSNFSGKTMGKALINLKLKKLIEKK